MPINELIARGVAPIGRDIPEIAGMLEQRRQQNALMNMRQGELDYQHTQDANALTRQTRMDQAALSEDDAKKVFAASAWALQSGDPVGAISQIPEIAQGLQSKGIDFRQWTPEQGKQFWEGMRMQAGGQAGIMPQAQNEPDKLYAFVGPNGKPQYGTPGQAVGQLPYEKPTQEPQGTWGQPFEGVDPQTGKPGLYQSHSITGQI